MESSPNNSKLNKIKEEKKDENKKTIRKIKSYGPHYFQFPSEEKIIKDLSLQNLPKEFVHNLLNKYEEFYHPVKKPVKNDWLWDVKETFQSFEKFSTGIRNSPSRLRNTIYIKNLDIDMENSLLTENAIEILCKTLSLYFPVNIKVKQLKQKFNLKKLEVPSRMNEMGIQYSGGEALNLLEKMHPKDGFLMIGVTSFDIYNMEDGNFVFGLASKMGCVGVISLNRFYTEFSDNIQNEEELFMRSLKMVGSTLVHEVGHLFGIKHCVYFNCKMNGHNSIKEHLLQAPDFCPMCIRKIWSVLNFDIKERLEAIIKELPNLYCHIDMKKEINFFEERLKSIKD